MYYVARTANNNIENQGTRNHHKFLIFFFFSFWVYFVIYSLIMYLLVSFRVQEGSGAKRREFVLQIAATATFPLIVPNALAENGEIPFSVFPISKFVPFFLGS